MVQETAKARAAARPSHDVSSQTCCMLQAAHVNGSAKSQDDAKPTASRLQYRTGQDRTGQGKARFPGWDEASEPKIKYRQDFLAVRRVAKVPFGRCQQEAG